MLDCIGAYVHSCSICSFRTWAKKCIGGKVIPLSIYTLERVSPAEIQRELRRRRLRLLHNSSTFPSSQELGFLFQEWQSNVEESIWIVAQLCHTSEESSIRPADDRGPAQGLNLQFGRADCWNWQRASWGLTDSSHEAASRSSVEMSVGVYFITFKATLAFLARPHLLFSCFLFFLFGIFSAFLHFCWSGLLHPVWPGDVPFFSGILLYLFELLNKKSRKG